MLKKILIATFAAILIVAIGAVAYNNVINAQAAGSKNAAAASGAAANATVTTGNNAAAPAPLYGNGNGKGNGGQGQGQGGNGGTGYGNGTGTGVLNVPPSALNSEETAALLFMREEEKLAYDVYMKMYETWGLPTFQNIASSEQKHMDEVALLLSRYNLADPAQAPGVFTDPKLQELYNSLVAQGSQSAAEALKVGGAIEEIDILDLQERLASTDNADIQLVFNNLMSGSYNHLQAFANAYSTQTGQAYTAQYLTAEQLNTILSSTGNGGGRPAWAGSGQGRGNR
jgi:hypothetical protein